MECWSSLPAPWMLYAVQLKSNAAWPTKTRPCRKDQRIEFRIGIHVGDIIVEENDIFGDGVNVAARLEGIAEPGGICISSSAYDQVRKNVSVEFVDLGEQTLKNIYRPIRAYAVGLSYQTDLNVTTSSSAPHLSLVVPTFDWNDITHFLAVAHHGSTIAIAKALNLDQSTVHRRLDNFEKQIGRPIVIRHATGYNLTAFGNELLPFARQVGEAINSLKRFVLASNETPTGLVRVTCSQIDRLPPHAIVVARYFPRSTPRAANRTDNG